jgi:hypothetical protein
VLISTYTYFLEIQHRSLCAQKHLEIYSHACMHRNSSNYLRYLRCSAYIVTVFGPTNEIYIILILRQQLTTDPLGGMFLKDLSGLQRVIRSQSWPSQLVLQLWNDVDSSAHTAT